LFKESIAYNLVPDLGLLGTVNKCSSSKSEDPHTFLHDVFKRQSFIDPVDAEWLSKKVVEILVDTVIRSSNDAPPPNFLLLLLKS
jgi:hypothetical protein